MLIDKFTDINYNSGMKNYKSGFTLAEVLITLAIIGVVAAITIPALVSKYQEVLYKAAYKKAFSDVNNAFQMLLNDGVLNQITWDNIDDDGNIVSGVSTSYRKNFRLLTNYMKVTKTCFDGADDTPCWQCIDAEQGQGGNADFKGNSSNCPRYVDSFVDSSGRAWSTYAFSMGNSNENVFIVDINGHKAPNELGKDRFPFSMKPHNKGTINLPDAPVNIRPTYEYDISTKERWCPSGKCYYYSWLFGKK